MIRYDSYIKRIGINACRAYLSLNVENMTDCQVQKLIRRVTTVDMFLFVCPESQPICNLDAWYDRADDK